VLWIEKINFALFGYNEFGCLTGQQYCIAVKLNEHVSSFKALKRNLLQTCYGSMLIYYIKLNKPVKGNFGARNILTGSISGPYQESENPSFLIHTTYVKMIYKSLTLDRSRKSNVKIKLLQTTICIKSWLFFNVF
jgi:hypothetical protein